MGGLLLLAKLLDILRRKLVSKRRLLVKPSGLGLLEARRLCVEGLLLLRWKSGLLELHRLRLLL